MGASYQRFRTDVKEAIRMLVAEVAGPAETTWAATRAVAAHEYLHRL